MSDKNLNWQEHTTELCTSLIKIRNSFKIIKHQILLYYAYICSKIQYKIQYGIEVYGGAAASLLKKVQSDLNRSIKILYSKDYYTPTKALHKEFNILTIEDISKLSTLKFVCRHQHNLLPEIFNEFYIETINVHQHKTRQSKGLHVTWPINKYCKSFIYYKGTIYWNLLPLIIKSAQTMKTFCKIVKQ